MLAVPWPLAFPRQNTAASTGGRCVVPLRTNQPSSGRPQQRALPSHPPNTPDTREVRLQHTSHRLCLCVTVSLPLCAWCDRRRSQSPVRFRHFEPPSNGVGMDAMDARTNVRKGHIQLPLLLLLCRCAILALLLAAPALMPVRASNTTRLTDPAHTITLGYMQFLVRCARTTRVACDRSAWM